jgi:gamma-glutamyl-gamma-aminobutyrate hydrolase PuuD
MSTAAPLIRIGICGPDGTTLHPERGWRLWPAGCGGAVGAAGAEAVSLRLPTKSQTWDDVLTDVQGVVLIGSDEAGLSQGAAEEGLCLWCRAHRLPLLAIDHGLHALNAAFGGSLHLDLARELPEALQHRHPPEPGLRHMITVSPGTRMAAIYGDGEIIVNSEHRRAVQRVARGFHVSARALDGVVEAIESEQDNWFALGVQWHPGSATASGLDIQVFRGLIGACRAPARSRTARKPRRVLARVA